MLIAAIRRTTPPNRSLFIMNKTKAFAYTYSGGFFMVKRIGAGTLVFENMPRIRGFASAAGKMESEGPLGSLFDKIIYDSRGGAETYEEAESRLQQEAALLAMEKSGLHSADIDYVFAGDLLNQCVGSSFGMMVYGIPFLGQYGACSTMAQALAMGAVFTESGAANNALCVTSSHFCAAERQYRFPMEYGEVRTPTAQWTVTGAGACVLSQSSGDVKIKAAAVGKITDMQITDSNNMGAAMAPAAADTIMRFLRDTGTSLQNYDRVFTGDLGLVGSEILHELLSKEGVNLNGRHNDCGLLIFDNATQDVHAGGSGCGCCASVLCTEILSGLCGGKYKNVLFIATGALLSATTAQQGKSIPSIAHLINLTV